MGGENFTINEGDQMKRTLGKWEQNMSLQQHPHIAKHIPETKLFNEHHLDDLLSRCPSVYVKHDTTGQGRAIFKIHKNADGTYYINGFTIQGKPIQKTVLNVNEIRQLLHPFIKLGRESGLYILQEDIQSHTQNGQPFSIRVHVQQLKNDWVIGGMYGTIANETVTESGIVNPHRGAHVMTIAEVLSQTKNKRNQKNTIKRIEEIATAAAKVIYSVLPNREYGMDFGLNQNGTPILFEVNTTPGISGFAKIENKALWKRIIMLRKMQST